MKHMWIVTSLVGIGMAGWLLAGSVASGQDDCEYGDSWEMYGGSPACPEESYVPNCVPDYARECQERWRHEEAEGETVAADRGLEAETAEDPSEDTWDEAQPIAQEPAGVEAEGWYDLETNQFHRYNFADTYDDLFALDGFSAPGQPLAGEGCEPTPAEASVFSAQDAEPMLAGPEVLLSVARGFDQAGSLLQHVSRQLTAWAQQELARVPTTAPRAVRR